MSGRGSFGYFWICWDSQGKVSEDRLALEISPLQEGQKERRGESPALFCGILCNVWKLPSLVVGQEVF